MPIDRVDTLLDTLEESQLLTPAQLEECRAASPVFADTRSLARHLLQRDWLTAYQVNHVLQGKAGELFFDNYVLLDRIGQGGMGQVFRARHRVMDRVVALKFIRPERLANPDLVKRFHREIRLAAQLAHPNIVIAYDADNVGDSHFLVMEFVEGTDLARFVEKNGRRPVMQACDWVRQAALGLQHAHERGMVHRDIKPANLLLAVKESVVKVLDMGLARLSQTADAELTAAGLTQEGTVMGTPDYMAPEQAEESTTVDTRADIYSLGCTLYFLLAGHVPFPGGTLAQKLRKHAQAEPQPLASLRDDVPAGLAAVLRKMMAKRPADRYQTPGEAAAALEPFCRPGPVAAIPVTAAAARPVAVPLSDETIPFAPHPVAVPVAVAAPAQAGETVPPSVLDSVPSVTLGKPLSSIARVQKAWRRLGRRGQLVAAGSAAVLLLALIIILLARKSPQPETPSSDNRYALERLDAKDIPPEDRPDGRVKELKDDLVAVLGEHRVRLSGYAGLAMRPDRALVAIADGPVIRLVDTRTLREVRELAGHTSAVVALAFSGDGKLLASGSQDRSLRLWNAETGKPLPEFPKAHGVTVAAVALTPDGRRVLAAGPDGKVYVWDTKSGERVATFTGHATPVRALAVSRDGKLAYSAAGNEQGAQDAQRDVHVWDVESGKAEKAGDGPRLLGGHAGFLSRLEVSPDGARLLAGTNTAQVYVWDLRGGADKTPLALTAYQPANYPSDGAFVGDDQLATVSGGRLKRWVPDGRGGYQDLDPIPVDVAGSGLAWLPAVPRENRPGAETDSGILFVAANTARVWNFAQNREWRPPLGHTQPARQLAFSGDGGWLMSAGQDEVVRFWNLADLYDPATGWPKEGRPAIPVAREGSSYFGGAAFSRDGNVVLTRLTGGSAATVWVWDSGSWNSLRKLDPKAAGEPALTALALNADGTRALTTAADKVLRLWDVKRAAEKQKEEGLPTNSSQLEFLTDGRAYSWDGAELRFWEGLADGETLRSVVAPGVTGVALTVSPEREVAYTGSGDGHLYRWTQIADGKPLRADLEHWHRGHVFGLALSPDRKGLLAASGDKRVGLWDLTGDPIAKPRLYDLRGIPWAVAFAPDGRHAAVANADGTIYILRLPR